MLGAVVEEMCVQDNIFLSTFDSKVSIPIQSSSIRYHTAVLYLSSGSTYEDIHPCVYAAKIQASTQNNPTYVDVLKSSTTERG